MNAPEYAELDDEMLQTHHAPVVRVVTTLLLLDRRVDANERDETGEEEAGAQ